MRTWRNSYVKLVAWGFFYRQAFAGQHRLVYCGTALQQK
jgi:hypothetical protein